MKTLQDFHSQHCMVVLQIKPAPSYAFPQATVRKRKIKMDDFREQEHWDEEEVRIEDLGAPRKGLAGLLFSCGEKWYAATRLRSMPVTLVRVIFLILLLLLPGSAFLRAVAPVSHSASLSAQQHITCIDIAISPTAVTTWLRQVAPTSHGGVIFRECGPAQSVGNNP